MIFFDPVPHLDSKLLSSALQFVLFGSLSLICTSTLICHTTNLSCNRFNWFYFLGLTYYYHCLNYRSILLQIAKLALLKVPMNLRGRMPMSLLQATGDESATLNSKKTGTIPRFVWPYDWVKPTWGSHVGQKHACKRGPQTYRSEQNVTRPQRARTEDYLLMISIISKKMFSKKLLEIWASAEQTRTGETKTRESFFTAKKR